MNGFFKESKEHFLLGIKGTIRRNLDSHIVNTNIDTDVVVTEDSFIPVNSNFEQLIPQELFNILSRLCLGRRRLFFSFKGQKLISENGITKHAPNGWLTIRETKKPSQYVFNVDLFEKNFIGKNGEIVRYLGTNEEIENLRPRSP